MKIGIIDSDLLDNGTTQPNLALMKISKYYKDKGHKVELLEDYNSIEEYDKVFLAKVFTFTKIPIDVSEYNNLIYGGTGFLLDGIEVPDLENEIEHSCPDYHLYENFINKKIKNGAKKSRLDAYFDYSTGFITRGCFRKCDFCVNKKYDKVFKHANIEEFLDPQRKRIYLLDDNFLAYQDWEIELDKLAKTKKYFQFKQGLDIRLLTEKKAEKLAKMKYYGDYIFAFDWVKDSKLIDEKLALWRKYSKKGTKLYLLCAYESTDATDIENLFKRMKILFKHNCLPYVMRFEDYKDSELKDMYTQLARWGNQPNMVKKMSFRQFCELHQETKKDKSTNSKTYQTMLDFEEKYPDIAKKYFDMQFSEE